MKTRKPLMVIAVSVAVVFLAGQAIAEPITINWWLLPPARFFFVSFFSPYRKNFVKRQKWMELRP